LVISDWLLVWWTEISFSLDLNLAEMTVWRRAGKQLGMALIGPDGHNAAADKAVRWTNR
jgi:hypothetical protein